MISGGSTVPRRQLGRELRALRDAEGIKADDVADRLDWSRSKIWRIETGQVPVKKTDVMALAQLYKADPQMVEVLLALAGESKHKGWWHSYGDVLPEWFEMYVGLESVAENMRHYDAELVPGLLQTADYCRAVCRAFSGGADSDIDRLVTLRMDRQAILTRESTAPRFYVILNESILRRPIGGLGVMVKQLEHLLEATDLPNVDVRVLPFHTAEHPAMMGTFVILSFPGRREPDVVYLESMTGSLYLEKPAELTKYNCAMRKLEQQALDSVESRAFIATAAKEM